MDEPERSYMAWRAVSLLLADGRPVRRRKSGQFGVTDRLAPETHQPPVVAVAELLSIWRFGMELVRDILPLFAPIEQGAVQVGESAMDVDGAVPDWEATLERWASDDSDDEVRMQRLRVGPDALVARLFAHVVCEFVARASLLTGDSRGKFIDWPETLDEVVRQVRYFSGVCGRRLQADDLAESRPDPRFVTAVGDDLRETLMVGSVGPRLVRQDHIGPLVSAVARHWMSQPTSRLLIWRERSRAQSVYIERSMRADVLAGTTAGLYELWCFAEFVHELRRRSNREVQLSSFLRTGYVDPVANLGSTFAYYDFRRRTFESIHGGARGADGPIGPVALPGAHVEWFLYCRSSYHDSVVVDAKYFPNRTWDSGEALKVLGYMANFGVRHGAIVFAGPLQSLVGVLPSPGPGLFCATCPGPERATLWVLSLRPSEVHAAANQATLTKFIECLEKRGVIRYTR